MAARKTTTKTTAKAKTRKAPAKTTAKKTTRKRAASSGTKRRKSKRALKTEEQVFKERYKKAEKICKLYENGTNTLASCCEEVGVSYGMFFEYRRQHSEIEELFEKAYEEHRKRRFQGLKEKSLNSFERLLVGYEYEETQTEGRPGEGGKVVVTKVTKSKKHVAPNPAMTAMAMRNWHGFKDRITLDGTIKHEHEFTDEDIKSIASEITAEVAGGKG